MKKTYLFIVLFVLMIVIWPQNVFADDEQIVCSYTRTDIKKGKFLIAVTDENLFPYIIKFIKNKGADVFSSNIPDNPNNISLANMIYKIDIAKQVTEYYYLNNVCPNNISFLGFYFFGNPAQIIIGTSYVAASLESEYYTKCVNMDKDLLGCSKYKLAEDNNPGTIVDNVKDCSDLFTPELLSLINEILGVTKIAVPIIVIAFGIIDFAQAVFSDKDDALKKAQSKFIKRLLLAVVFFLLPFIVNFLLTSINGIINGGWNTCGIG